MQSYLRHRQWWTDEEENKLLQSVENDIQQAVDEAKSLPLPGPESQFEDMFEQPTWMLEEQRIRLLAEAGSSDTEEQL